MVALAAVDVSPNTVEAAGGESKSVAPSLMIVALPALEEFPNRSSGGAKEKEFT